MMRDTSLDELVHLEKKIDENQKTTVHHAGEERPSVATAVPAVATTSSASATTTNDPILLQKDIGTGTTNNSKVAAASVVRTTCGSSNSSSRRRSSRNNNCEKNDDDKEKEEEKKQDESSCLSLAIGGGGESLRATHSTTTTVPTSKATPPTVRMLPPAPPQQQQQPSPRSSSPRHKMTKQQQQMLHKQQQNQQAPNQPPKDYLRHVVTTAATTTDTTTSAAAAAAAGGGIISTTISQPRKAGTSWWERVVVQRSSYVVEDLVEQYTADSAFLQSPPFPVAFLDRIELETADLLGSGTYSNVYQVKRLQLLPDYLTDHPQQNQLRRALVETSHHHQPIQQQQQQQQQEGQQPPPEQLQDSDSNSVQDLHGYPRIFSTNSNTNTGYAVKHLKSELLQNSKLFEAAAADLIMEAKYLARLDHENILRLRGMALGGTSTFAATGLFDSYFLVVDELQETLIQRIHHWKIQGSTDQYRADIVLHKLQLAVQVASALAYLHERRLVFRDLKPHNIGIKKLPYENAPDIIQLFDFGFCRELPNPASASSPMQQQQQHQGPPPTMVNVTTSPPKAQNDDRDDADGDDLVDLEDVDVNNSPREDASVELNDADDETLFCMSGKGTLLYMASEVLSSRCYNQKADVYSWSMVTYELLTLQKPYAVGSIEQHKKVVCERGERPPLDHLRWLPRNVKELLQHSWQANVQARWHMRDVKESLDGIIHDLENHRSTFRKESSFNSFGYTAYTNPPKYFVCQGVDVEDIILDIRNTVQTRYEYITQQLFCKKDTTTNASTAAAKGTTNLRDTNALIKSSALTENSSGETGQEMTLKGFINTTQGTASSLTFSQDIEVIAPAKDQADSSGGDKKDEVKNDDKPLDAKKGQEEHKDENFVTATQASISSAFWGNPSLRIHPTTSTTSEQFPMTSLCMHSVRLNAARNRKPKSLPTSPRIASQSLTDSSRYAELGRTASSTTQQPASTSLVLKDDEAAAKNVGGQKGDGTEGRVLQTIKSDDDGDIAILQTIKSDDDGDECLKDALLKKEAEDGNASNNRESASVPLSQLSSAVNSINSSHQASRSNGKNRQQDSLATRMESSRQQPSNASMQDPNPSAKNGRLLADQNLEEKRADDDGEPFIVSTASV